NASGVWNVGSLSKGASTVLTLTATVNSGTVNQTIFDTASAQAKEIDPNPANNTGSASLTIQPSADLNVTQQLDDLKPIQGELIHYTITVDNNAGPEAGTGVKLSDVLSSNLTFQSASTSVGSFDRATGVWNLGSLAQGASATLVIAARVNPNSLDQQVSNVA